MPGRLQINALKAGSFTSLDTSWTRTESGTFSTSQLLCSENSRMANSLEAHLYERASYVKNPYYELNKKAGEGLEKDYDPQQMARDFIEAMQQIPETSCEFVNSYEIFAESCKKRYVNSEGIDVTISYPSSTVEVVVNARDDAHEIELYRLYTAGTCDRDNLVKEITQTLKYGKDRLVAVPTPALGKATVLFPTMDSTEIYKWFARRMHAQYKYRGFSNWEKGKPICDDVKGDTFTIKAVKELPNSSKNMPVDAEGAKIRDMYIIKENVPENFWGDAQFRYYLGVTDGFIAGNFVAEGGTLSESEIRSGNYLEPVEFSDFSIDVITGDIAGEIRLAYLHEGDKITPVTGGSVSGSLLELIKDARFSKETRQYDNCLIPSVTRLSNVTVTGA